MDLCTLTPMILGGYDCWVNPKDIKTDLELRELL
jgi:hypothetical protein